MDMTGRNVDIGVRHALVSMCIGMSRGIAARIERAGH